MPLAWLGVGGRFDAVQPDLDDSTQNFSVLSPRLTSGPTSSPTSRSWSSTRATSTAATTAVGRAACSRATARPGGASMGVDKNAAQIAAIIWF